MLGESVVPFLDFKHVQLQASSDTQHVQLQARSDASTVRHKHTHTHTHTHVQLQASSDTHTHTFSCKHAQTQAPSAARHSDTSMPSTFMCTFRRKHVQCCMWCLSTQARSDARSDATTFSAACCASRCRHLGPEIGCHRTSGPMAVACAHMALPALQQPLPELGDPPQLQQPLRPWRRALPAFSFSPLERQSHACLVSCIHLVQRVSCLNAPPSFTTCFSCTSIMCNVLLVSMRLRLVFTTS